MVDTVNLYPSGGAPFLFSEPQEQKQERETEKANVYAAQPLIEAVLAHFDERIAFRDSIKAVNVNIAEDPELHQKTCVVNDAIADALRKEKELLVNRLDEIK